MQIKEMLQVCQILNEYCPDEFLCAEHDEVWIGDPRMCLEKKMPLSTFRELKKLGCSIDRDTDSFHMFV